MKTKVLGMTVAVLTGLIVGLMFNSIQKTNALTRQLVRQQAEAVDLLRTMVEDKRNMERVLIDMASKINNVDAILKRLPIPGPQAQQAQRPPQEDFDTVYTIPQGASVIKGSDKAPITIVGFLDLQCPFSKKFQPVIDQVLEAYPGNVKYMVKHFPLSFHQQAAPAAKALLAAAEQGKFYEMMDLVLENNRVLSKEKYEDLAKELGLNLKKFHKALADNDEAWTTLIQEDFALGQKVGVRGTPTYYLNGKKTQARSLDAFKAEIDKILSSEN